MGVEAVPYELTWLALLTWPDILRKLFKLNVEAIKLVVYEPDFFIPLTTMTVGSAFCWASFRYDGSSGICLLTYLALYLVAILLGER